VSNVNDLVKGAVDAANRAATKEVEDKVSRLVNSIISAEAQIGRLATQIAEYKKELAAIQMPAPVALSV
jgi:hypothetical protein